MERVDRLVRTWIATEQEQEIEETASGTPPPLTPADTFALIICVEISQGNVTLLSVVKSLGEFLTSEEDEMRTKGSYSPRSHPPCFAHPRPTSPY